MELAGSNMNEEEHVPLPKMSVTIAMALIIGAYLTGLATGALLAGH